VQYEQQQADQQESAEAVTPLNLRAEGRAHLTNLRLAAVATVSRNLTSRSLDTMTVKAVGRVLGHSDLEDRLRARGMLDASGLPYPLYENCRFFARERRADGSERALVLSRGMTWIAREYPPPEQTA
jgi:hypothetical protein